MDFNLVVLGGRLAAPTELIVGADGSRRTRCLVAVRSGHPRPRIDVVPVLVRGALEGAEPGVHLWVAGTVQRCFSDAAPGQRSRLEIHAHHVEVRRDDR